MRRLRWYHLYIVLAGVNVLVIATGLWLHHRSLGSFEGLLTSTASFDARERDLSALGQAVMQLSAPAMDVVWTGAVDEERTRFRRFQADLGALKTRLRISSKQMKEFWEEIGHVCRAQERLFDEVERDQAASSSGDTALLLSKIDSHRRRAMRLIVGRQEALLSEAAEHHLDHAELLARQGMAEVVLAVGLVGALAGMVWYTRRLQRTDEALRTERKRVQEERRERLAMIGELCTGVAHGIQNPLAAIRSSAELMLDMGTMDGATRARAEDVMTECTRLSQRVRRLLGFARAAEPARTRVRAAEIVAGVIRELSQRIDERRIEVVLALDDRALVVDADPDELASVFLELLSNAIDHTPSGGRVEVSGKATSEWVTMEVRDTGPGIPTGTGIHVFDLFFTTREGGTGVGLAWARRIVQSLNGSVELVPPSDGPGATFRVKLPRSSACVQSMEYESGIGGSRRADQLAGRTS